MPRIQGFLGLTVLLAGLVATGCGGSRPCRLGAGGAPGHLLFDPAPAPVSPTAFVRADWPATEGYDNPREVILYRETVQDRQGWFGLNQDRPYRRFDSVRTGRTRR